MVEMIIALQNDYILAKPARDAAAKAKMQAEASTSVEGPLHFDNEWNIRYNLALLLFSLSLSCNIREVITSFRQRYELAESTVLNHSFCGPYIVTSLELEHYVN